MSYFRRGVDSYNVVKNVPKSRDYDDESDSSLNDVDLENSRSHKSHNLNQPVFKVQEEVLEYKDYGAAAKAASSWVTNGNDEGTPEEWKNQFVLYKSTAGPYKGKVVGLGRQKGSNVEDLIRIDLDPGCYGIHFNAKYKMDSKKKLAAKLAGTRADTTANKKAYEGYVTKLEGKTAKQIWEAWRKGNAPGP